MKLIIIAIGANLPALDGSPALETCRRAAAALDRLPGYRLRALSRWFATAPVPPSPTSPDYVNGVALLRPEGGQDVAAAPAALLRALQGIEDAFGRVRPYPNAPRTLDLDIIGMDGLLRDTPDPILPHPRAHQRAFVLAPLCDVAPGWVHPRLGTTAAQLLAAVGEAGTRPLG
ncbi:2-amino-4-hydroxy-6-hydroxymethyldihydropteridine diphosphokinase [Roseomonas stagni]|uniref:2-amino-4-hydroxy-6-hydroxymethyldihydropteridine pyrophosphokinase n=1 Tax=Falsiroseomonas algicola TaxID=2716930 RepID=A0A6M1LPC5_9PROT|nr:2-amino-4-hydroxy-6-hydroxymethyldihydropteridine diphosphokinase [Falsiroseomonas algicola]NGM21892.1 2-amino-4-hydroxy-6-hydroxymethyldihydropteridine diphosphokinase [Falsiroseomonas algicola]